jgi:alpha-L-fucosidase
MIASLAALALLGSLLQDYVPPADPAVRAKLESWQDKKFGLMMHWGTYSQWGIVESWSLCSEDQPWCSRDGANYVDYCREYETLIETFNPTQFDPARWASAAKGAGMKYVVFTTKHHDGFSMFDTQLTDYSVTGERCAFSTNPKANITKEVFDAFRAEGFWTGAYFSKPDWHHPDYWAPEFATPNRCNNYDVRKYPERWKRFQDFTFGQIEELMTGYGDVDILWLDGGWVRPNDTITDEVRAWGYQIPAWEQSVDMPRIAKMARAHQPGLIVVDRSVHGPYEDYRTPEQHVPGELLPYPWETCMTMTQSWSYNREPEYKSTRELIHTLVDVVAKGGNYLLNVGPGPDGTLDDEAYERLKGIGEWLDTNGEAIYGTRPALPFAEGAVRYTQKDGAVYATVLVGGDEPMPTVVEFPGWISGTRKARVLGTGALGLMDRRSALREGGDSVLLSTEILPAGWRTAFTVVLEGAVRL